MPGAAPVGSEGVPSSPSPWHKDRALALRSTAQGRSVPVPGCPGSSSSPGNAPAQLSWALPARGKPSPARALLHPRKEAELRDTTAGVYFTLLCTHLDTAIPGSSAHPEDELQFQQCLPTLPALPRSRDRFGFEAP